MLNIVTTPQILTDVIFTAYGGQTGTSTPAQREAAYAIAEGQAAQEIGTFIQPTIVTGTYNWPITGQPIQLENDRLIGVLNVAAIHESGCNCAADSVELTGCVWIKSGPAGVVEVRECGNTIKAACSGCNCGKFGRPPLQVRIVYEAGLPTGAVSDPRLLMGLTTAADLALEQIIDPASAEGGAGDPGVKSFSSLSYSETRFGLVMTAFGASARANLAARNLGPFKYKKVMGLGR